jgi:TonB family protein
MTRRSVWLVLLVSTAPLHAQGVFAGKLMDPKLGTPLPCVDVSLEDSSAHEIAHALTNADGAFQFDSPPSGSFRPRFSVWSHGPAYGAYEMLDSAIQRARVYRIDFGPESLADPRKWADSADAPPGFPLYPDKVHPEYSDGFRERGIEGDVVVQFVEDSTGWVVQSSLKVLQATRPEFGAAAERYLRLAQFEPARRGGKPVCALVTGRPFTYRLGH